MAPPLAETVGIMNAKAQDTAIPSLPLSVCLALDVVIPKVRLEQEGVFSSIAALIRWFRRAATDG